MARTLPALPAPLYLGCTCVREEGAVLILEDPSLVYAPLLVARGGTVQGHNMGLCNCVVCAQRGSHSLQVRIHRSTSCVRTSPSKRNSKDVPVGSPGLPRSVLVLKGSDPGLGEGRGWAEVLHLSSTQARCRALTHMGLVCSLPTAESPQTLGELSSSVVGRREDSVPNRISGDILPCHD